jgi:hypothetical protein
MRGGGVLKQERDGSRPTQLDANFIWGIADGIVDQRLAFQKATGQSFYNTSSFTHYFYKPQPLRTLEQIRADILALEKETEGLLDELVGKARTA